MNQALEPYDLHFGYRVIDEIALFFKNAKESKNKGIVELKNDDEIFDLAILPKMMPSFGSSAMSSPRLYNCSKSR